MIGYLLEQELGNLLPVESAVCHAPDHDRGRRRTTRLSRIRPSSSGRSTTGPRPSASPPRSGWISSRTAASGGGWCLARAQRIFEIRPIQLAAGARHDRHLRRRRRNPDGLRPTVRDRTLMGVEVVIDKDFAGALLARDSKPTVRHGDRRRGGLPRLGQADRALVRARHARRAQPVQRSRPAAWAPRVDAACEFVDGSAGRRPPSARSPTSSVWSPARRARCIVPAWPLTTGAGASCSPPSECSPPSGRSRTRPRWRRPRCAPGSRPGFWALTSLVVGNVIGSSIFLLPSLLAPFGGLAIVSWLITSAGALAPGAGVCPPGRAGPQRRAARTPTRAWRLAISPGS